MKLGLQDEESVAAAYEDIAARLGPRVLISGMARGQAEMAFGLVRDPQFGSFVMVAFGGIWIEVLKDSQLAMVPIDREVTARRIAELTTMQNDTILYARSGPVAQITLNRPDKLNSITIEMVEGLHRAMDRAETDPEVRVILISGAGKPFSAGFDLGSMEEEPDREAARAMLQADFDVILRFWNSPKPTISAVQGYVLGGGFELAMACDVTIAAEDAIFGNPGRIAR